MRARTAVVEEARARRAALEQPISEPRAKELLGSAAAKARPSEWSRLKFPKALSADESDALRRTGEQVGEAGRLLRSQAERAGRFLDALERAAKDSSSSAVILGRLARQRALLEERQREIDALARIADALPRQDRSFGRRLLHFGAKLIGRDPETALSRVRARLFELDAQSQILGTELNYVRGELAPSSLPAGGATAAYLDVGPSGLTIEDTTQGREVELSSDVMSKAQVLGTAKAAAEFVRNQMRLDWYLGALKGSTETLREGRGNDADLAALLIAMLRAQGTPARFVRGTIQIPTERLASLMGLLDAQEASSLDAGTLVLAEPVRGRVLAVLAQAGIPYAPVVAGGQVASVQLQHVWTEAYLPYANYRGAGSSAEGRQWVPIEPSFTGKAKYGGTPPALDALDSMGASAAALTDAFLAQSAQPAPLAFYRAQIGAFLAANRPELTYAQVLRVVTQRPESFGFLPGALPFDVVSVQDEGAFLPDAFKQRLHLTLSDGAGSFLDAVVPLHRLAGHRSLLTFKPATDADAQIVGDAGGFYQAPAAAVEVTAVLRIDGAESAVATRSVGLGAQVDFRLELLLPDGSSRLVENKLIAGNIVAVGVGGPRNAYVEPAVPPPTDRDGDGAKMIYARAVEFANSWTDGEEELARLVQAVPVRPTANIVFVQYQLQVEEALGVRKQVHFRGVEVDADLRTLAAVELLPGRAAALLRLSGYEGSYQESRVLASGLGLPAISATGVLQQAAAQGIPVLHLTPQNEQTQFALLTTAAPGVAQDVRDHLARGREVLIPETDLSLQDWHGIGYIVRDAATEEGGYFLSGQVAGAQTILSPASWSDPTLAEALENAAAPQVVDGFKHPDQIARIIKVETTDGQSGVVNKPLPKSIRVFVTTIDGVPVKSAPVTFKAADVVSLPTFPTFAATRSATPAPQLTVTTDSRGSASVLVIPDKKIQRAQYLLKKKPFDQEVGLNAVAATTTDGTRIISINQPFLLTGLPDIPAKLNLSGPSSSQPKYVEFGGPLVVELTDQHGNVLANEVVTFAQFDPASPSPVDYGSFIDDSKVSGPGPYLYDASHNDPSQVRTLPITTNTFGNAETRFIGAGPPGDIDVVLAASTGSIAERRQFRLTQPKSDSYLLRGASAKRTGNPIGVGGLHGLYPMKFDHPVLFRVLHNDGSGIWSPLKGTEPGLQVSVRMEVVDAKGTAISTQTARPSDLATSPATAALDDDTTVVFWPSYMVKDDWETVLYTAKVLEDQPNGGKKTLCCGEVYVDNAYGGTATVDRLHMPAGTLATVPTDALGTVQTSDTSVTFKIGNPTDAPLHFRLQQTGDLLYVPGPDALPRHASDPGLIVVSPETIGYFAFLVQPGNAGGVVRLRLYAQDPLLPGFPPAVQVAETSIKLQPSNGLAAGDGLRARVILPQRIFDEKDALFSPPILVPAPLQFALRGNGLVRVTSGGQLVAGAKVSEDSFGALIIVGPLPGPTPPPLLSVRSDNLLAAAVPPGDPAGQTVVIAVTREDGTTQTVQLPLFTSIEDRGAAPWGHDFVKGVSVVDGHLAMQSEDYALKGRGPALHFLRTFTSRGGSAEPGPLGAGWDSNLRSYALPDPNGVMIVADGTGQTFRCPNQTNCTPQHGHHGTLRLKTRAGGGVEWVFRDVTGVEYHFGEFDTSTYPQRYKLSSIVDPVGNRVSYEYGGPGIDHEVSRIYEAGYGRFLQLSYSRPPTTSGSLEPVHVQLDSIELMRNPAPGAPLVSTGPQAAFAAPLGVCIKFSYGAHQLLSAVARLKDGCSGTVVREESYQYSPSSDPELYHRLTSHTDPNGHATSYNYFAKGTVLPGTTAYLSFTDTEQRVEQIFEPLGVTTTFSYGLQPAPVAMFGTVQLLYETVVTGPVPGRVRKFRLQGAGVSSEIEQSLTPTTTATVRSQWDLQNLRIVTLQDGRGRVTTYAYDANGNRTEERVLTPMLPPSGSAPQTQPLTDGNGAALSEVVERWAYDPAFSTPICHIDREGRATQTTVDSNGQDPRTGVPQGTGLPLATRRLKTKAADCASLFPDPDDIEVRQAYCGILAGPCPPLALFGDLSKTIDGNVNSTEVLAYDGDGNLTGSRLAVGAGSFVTTTRLFDDRSREFDRKDTQGHHTTTAYDGLDRVIQTVRENTKGAPLATSRTYYPGGEVKTETNGLGLTRTAVLDDLNRPSAVTIAGGPFGISYQTAHSYDEEGRPTSFTDERGVQTRTTFDLAGRPLQVEQAVDDAVAYADQHGADALPHVFKLVSTAEYDAVGNKVAETDLHGHRTVYLLDPLYRTVAVRSPQVPGPGPADLALRSYDTVRRYDRDGNKTFEADGNGHATVSTWDFVNRLAATTDAAGRSARTQHDKNGNPIEETREFAGVVQYRKRTSGFDGLNRPLAVEETLLSTVGPPISPITYHRDNAYEDTQAARASAARDARGVVTTRLLDDLDRPYREIVDDDAGLLNRQIDNGPAAGPPLRLKRSFTYDANGNPAQVTDALNRVTSESYDGLNRVRTRALPLLGVTESFQYDGNGRQIEKVDRRGITTQTFFDLTGRLSQDRLIESISAAGAPLVVRHQFYDDGAGADGTVTMQEQDANGHSTLHVLDGLHREIRTFDARGFALRSFYDAAVKRASTDRRGFRQEFAYDAANRPLSENDLDLDGSLKWSTTTSYDDQNRRVVVRDRNAVPKVTERDSLDRVERVTRGAGADTQAGAACNPAGALQVDVTSFDGAGNAVRTVDGNCHVTASSFDGANRRVRQTRAVGMPEETVTSFKVDEVGNLLEQKSARVTGSTFDVRNDYDDLNRVVRSENALGEVASHAYDGAGNRVCEKRPLGGSPLASGAARRMSLDALATAVCGGAFVTTYSYDELSKLISVKDAQQGVTTFVYDRARNLIAQQDANEHLTTFEHDANNRLVVEHQFLDAAAHVGSRDALPVPAATSNPIAGTGTLNWTLGYDETGNLISRVDPKGQLSSNRYGVLNRLEQEDFTVPAGTARELPALESIRRVYDGNGNLVEVDEKKMTAAGEVTEKTLREYDVFDRLKRETRYDAKIVAFTYDAKGNRLSVTDPDQVGTVYTYDGLDRLASVALAEGTTQYSYWPDSLEKARSSPGINEARCYDAAGRTVAVVTSHGVIQQTDGTASAPEQCAASTSIGRFDDSYDADGNRLQRIEQRTNPATQLPFTGTTRYGYDDLDRLAGVAYPGGNATLYRLDAVGNRTGERMAPASKVPALTALAFNQVAAADLTHDISAVFGRADWLLSRFDALDASRSASFDYDANGNMVARRTAAATRDLRWDVRNTLTSIAEAGTTVGRYDYRWDRLRMKRAAQGQQVEYVLDDQFVLTEGNGATAGHATTRRYHYGQHPLAASEVSGASRSTTWISVDSQSSITDTTAADGSVRTSRQHDAWGNYANGTAPTATEPKLGYTGHQYDPESGLTYARARYYDAQVGIFLSRDPVAIPLDDAPALHRYLYTRANPLRYVDPTGDFEEPIHGALTYHLALLAGFTEHDAANIALATAGVDHNPATAPVSLGNVWNTTVTFHHFVEPSEALARVNGVIDTVEKRRQSAGVAWCGENCGQLDLREFGKALHTLEDVGFVGALGPHKRGEEFRAHGILNNLLMNDNEAGHPYYKRADGTVAGGLSHENDQPWHAPAENQAELMKIFDVLVKAAQIQNRSVEKNEAQDKKHRAEAEKRITRFIVARTPDEISAVLQTVPEGATHSYKDLVRDNPYEAKMAPGEKWGPEGIDATPGLDPKDEVAAQALREKVRRIEEGEISPGIRQLAERYQVQGP